MTNQECVLDFSSPEARAIMTYEEGLKTRLRVTFTESREEFDKLSLEEKRRFC